MIVFNHQQKFCSWRERRDRVLAEVQQLKNTSNLESVRKLLIDFGELESGIADSLLPQSDSTNEICALLRSAGLMTGRLLYRTWRGEDAEPSSELNAIAEALRSLPSARLPEMVPQPISEGYAFYSLYPEVYLHAAERFLPSGGCRIVCIGIRSIGTSLSSAVAAVAEARSTGVWSLTVRPRGHPWNRKLEVGPELDAELISWADAYFCIVDEGPGMSGSSFASVFEHLRKCGIPVSRILLFPSVELGSDQLRSEIGRRVWDCAQKAVCALEDSCRDSRGLRQTFNLASIREISAGKWRRVVYDRADEYPAIFAQHERRKYICILKGSSRPSLLKFEGLSHYGESIRDRARD